MQTNRVFTLIALLFAIVGAIFILGSIGGAIGNYLIIAALILHIIGTLTGR